MQRTLRMSPGELVFMHKILYETPRNDVLLDEYFNDPTQQFHPQLIKLLRNNAISMTIKVSGETKLVYDLIGDQGNLDRSPSDEVVTFKEEDVGIITDKKLIIGALEGSSSKVHIQIISLTRNPEISSYEMIYRSYLNDFRTDALYDETFSTPLKFTDQVARLAEYIYYELSEKKREVIKLPLKEVPGFYYLESAMYVESLELFRIMRTAIEYIEIQLTKLIPLLEISPGTVSSIAVTSFQEKFLQELGIIDGLEINSKWAEEDILAKFRSWVLLRNGKLLQGGELLHEFKGTHVDLLSQVMSSQHGFDEKDYYPISKIKQLSREYESRSFESWKEMKRYINKLLPSKSLYKLSTYKDGFKLKEK